MTHTIGMKPEHVKRILEEHLVPTFDGTKVTLTVPSPEVYEKIINQIVFVANASNIMEL